MTKCKNSNLYCALMPVSLHMNQSHLLFMLRVHSQHTSSQQTNRLHSTQFSWALFRVYNVKSAGIFFFQSGSCGAWGRGRAGGPAAVADCLVAVASFLSFMWFSLNSHARSMMKTLLQTVLSRHCLYSTCVLIAAMSNTL